jgi:hypothetical protein
MSYEKGSIWLSSYCAKTPYYEEITLGMRLTHSTPGKTPAAQHGWIFFTVGAAVTRTRRGRSGVWVAREARDLRSSSALLQTAAAASIAWLSNVRLVTRCSSLQEVSACNSSHER